MIPMATGRLSPGRWKRRVSVKKRSCKSKIGGTISVFGEVTKGLEELARVVEHFEWM